MSISSENLMPSCWHRFCSLISACSSLSGEDFSLLLASITHTYLLFHCAPYIGYMAVQLINSNNDNVNVDSVGWYAGLLGTAFTSGRFLSFVAWRRIRYHFMSVKQALMLSLALSAICSVWFGLSRTYLQALLARLFLGISNALSGCIKRITMDRAIAAHTEKKIKQETNDDEEGENGDNNNNKDNKQREEELAPAFVLSIMMWGSALGPCVGGMFANPGTYSKDTFLPDSLENQYPFFLPNLVACILCLASMIAVGVFIVDKGSKSKDGTTSTPTTTSSNAEERRPLLQSRSSKGVNLYKQIWRSKNAKLHFLAYWTFSFVVVCVDEALPLFLIARLSGPGLSPSQIGWILSVGGLLTSFNQSIEVIIIKGSRQMYDMAVDRMYKNLSTAAFLSNVPTVLIPLILVINGGTYYQVTTAVSTTIASESAEQETFDAPPGFLAWQSFIFLAMLLGILRIFSSLYVNLIGIATSRIVPQTHRNEVSHIVTRGALFSRSIAPVVAGSLVSFFMGSPGALVDSFQLWAVIGLVLGLGFAVFTLWLETTPMGVDAKLRSEKRKLYLDSRERASVHVRLWEVQYDQGSDTVAAKWRRLTRKVIAVNRVSGFQNQEQNSTKNTSNAKKGYRRTSWVDHVLRPGLDLEEAEFLILGTNQNDRSCSPHVLTPPLMESLRKYLPMACADQNFWMRYSLMRDGDSIPALESRICMAKNTFIAVETLQGDVFGCFMTYKWQKTSKFEPCGESFLWRMKYPRCAASADDEALEAIAKNEDEVEIFRWTGADDQCQYLSDERIGAGGGGGDGFGFMIEDGLWKGTSCPCETYNNPSLIASPDNLFEVANMEVWAMTPFLFVDEAEKNEASRRFIMEQADPTSVTSSWTKYI